MGVQELRPLIDACASLAQPLHRDPSIRVRTEERENGYAAIAYARHPHRNTQFVTVCTVLGSTELAAIVALAKKLVQDASALRRDLFQGENRIRVARAEVRS